MSRKERILQLLNQEMALVHLTVENESANHHVPQGAETHFKIIAVSRQFNNSTLIVRHRLLNKILNQEFTLGLHALSMHLYTPEEWAKNKTVLKSPACRDGIEK